MPSHAMLAFVVSAEEPVSENKPQRKPLQSSSGSGTRIAFYISGL